MTETATAPTPSPVRSFETTEPRARFADLVAAEWIKLWSLRSTHWAFLGGALAVIGFNVFTTYNDYSNWPGWSPQQKAEFMPNWAMLDTFTDAAVLCLMLTASAMGALTVVGEYSTGLIHTTFTAVPARRSVMAAKVLVVTLVTTALGLFAAGGSFWLTQAILSGRDTGLSLGDPGVVPALLASALVAPVAALVGMAVGALLRAGAATMGVSFAVLLLVPMAVSDDHYGTAVVDHLLPYSAWARLIQVVEKPAHFPWSQGGAWAVYAAWGLISAVITVVAVQRRDQ
ncbi:ABC transporter permease [Streptomyces atratus]|uniref:ABC transporter permease n=1 Tax=Streptomyces atratus TaxID=1893 RepID=A0A2Z5J667_STRAR|nr:ABC transporter permease [Streptomyces atratus]AXE75802.1 ABC transporter permease [Streptomyces atratus]AXE82364.1 ABC transporter permease [Streptomyces atratus]